MFSFHQNLTGKVMFKTKLVVLFVSACSVVNASLPPSQEVAAHLLRSSYQTTTKFASCHEARTETDQSLRAVFGSFVYSGSLSCVENPVRVAIKYWVEADTPASLPDFETALELARTLDLGFSIQILPVVGIALTPTVLACNEQGSVCQRHTSSLATYGPTKEFRSVREVQRKYWSNLASNFSAHANKYNLLADLLGEAEADRLVAKANSFSTFTLWVLPRAFLPDGSEEPILRANLTFWCTQFGASSCQPFL